MDSMDGLEQREFQTMRAAKEKERPRTERRLTGDSAAAGCGLPNETGWHMGMEIKMVQKWLFASIE